MIAAPALHVSWAANFEHLEIIIVLIKHHIKIFTVAVPLKWVENSPLARFLFTYNSMFPIFLCFISSEVFFDHHT